MPLFRQSAAFGGLPASPFEVADIPGSPFTPPKS
jgi:hypothetical protein